MWYAQILCGDASFVCMILYYTLHSRDTRRRKERSVMGQSERLILLQRNPHSVAFSVMKQGIATPHSRNRASLSSKLDMTGNMSCNVHAWYLHTEIHCHSLTTKMHTKRYYIHALHVYIIYKVCAYVYMYDRLTACSGSWGSKRAPRRPWWLKSDPESEHVVRIALCFYKPWIFFYGYNTE